MKEKNFNVEEIEKCVNDTFVDGNIQNDNQVLMKERTLFLGEGIQIWPSIRINNVTYRVKIFCFGFIGGRIIYKIKKRVLVFF